MLHIGYKQKLILCMAMHYEADFVPQCHNNTSCHDFRRMVTQFVRCNTLSLLESAFIMMIIMISDDATHMPDTSFLWRQYPFQ